MTPTYSAVSDFARRLDGIETLAVGWRLMVQDSLMWQFGRAISTVGFIWHTALVAVGSHGSIWRWSAAGGGLVVGTVAMLRAGATQTNRSSSSSGRRNGLAQVSSRAKASSQDVHEAAQD